MKGKRFLSLLLCLVMVLSCLPISVFAAFLEPSAGATIDASFRSNKYDLTIKVVNSKGDTIDSSMQNGSATYWTLKSGKLQPKQKKANNKKNAIPVTDAFLCGSETAGTATYGYPVTATITPATGYSYKNVYKITNTSYDPDNGKPTTVTATVKDLVVTKNADGTITVKIAPGPETKCEPNSMGDKCNLVLMLEFEGSVDPEYQVSLYPVPGRTATSDAITQTRKAGEKVAFPTETQLLTYSPEYFSAAEVDAWYTKAPIRQKDGTYLYDENAKFDPATTVTGKLALYAKPKVKTGAQLTARAYLVMYDPLSDGNYQTNGGYLNLLYTPAGDAETYSTTKTATQYWKLPVGSVWTADNVPATGSYKDIIKNASIYPIPEKGAAVTGWAYRDTDNYEVLHEIKAGEQISAEYAQKLLLKGLNNENAFLDVYMAGELQNTITFDFTDANLAQQTCELKVPIANGGSSAKQLGSDQLKTITDAVTSKEDTEGFRKLFRGWYLTKKHTGKAVNLAEQYFYGEATLYARWEDAYTLKYDFGDFTPTNKQLFAETRVAKGDKLKEPTTRPAAGDAAFDGWYTDKDYTTKWNFDTDTVTDNVTLYAEFKDAKQIPVTFTRAQADNKNEKVQVTVRSNTPVVANYPFGPLPELPCPKKGSDTETEWGTTIYVDEGTTRTLTYTGWTFVDQENKTQPLTENTILANYLADDTKSLEVTAAYNVSFTISFDLDGGTAKNPRQVEDIVINAERGKATKPADDPEKEGKDFGGWINKDTGAAFDFDAEYTENTVIQAKWVDEKEYTVKFKLTPADAAITVKKQNSDTAATPTAPVDENGNVTFKLTKGTYTWSVSADGYKTIQETLTVAKDYNEENVIEVTLSTFQPVTGITLNLPDSKIMQKKSYDLSSLATVEPENASNQTITWTVSGNDGVTLGGEDGKTLMVSDTAVVDSTVTLTATITNGKLSDDGTEEADYTQDFTLTITKYLATISFEHGTGEHPNAELPKPQSVKDDSTLDAPTLSASGWTFDGWYKEAACTTKWKAEDTFEADTTLYAKWTKNPVDVTITFAGGEGATLNTSMSSTHNGKSGDEITLPPCMYTKSGYIFRSWGGTFAGTEYTLPEEAVTFTASWTQVSAAISEDDITHALDGLTVKDTAGNDVAIENIQKYKPQLLAVRDALAAGTATKTNATLIAKLSGLFEAAGLGPVSIDGDAKNGVSEVGAILSSDGAKVVLTVNKQATPGKTLPEAYQNAEYKSAWYSLSMTVGGTTTEPKVPVILTMPIPAALSEMAADTIRVLLYKGAATEPIVMTPTVNGSNLTFAYDGNGQLAFVGKSISDAADTRVTALVMKYNGTTMGNVNPQGVIEPDENGNFTVLLPSTTSESTLQDLASGINSKWVTYMTVAPKATVKPSDGGAQNAEYWAKTGLTLTYSLTNSNKYSDSKTFTVTAENGTTRNFTVTVKKITSEDRTYKIAVANISGGTITATPNPAAAGEEVKLTVEPNDGKKLIAGSLSYCLQSAGAKSVPIDENTRTFIMPAGDININAQFEDDASAPIKNPPQITAFMINGVSAVINSDTKAITIILPYGTDLKHVAPTIVTANASKVEPSSAQRVDLSTPKAYRVYASNGAYVTYTVTAYTEEPSPTQSLWEKLQNQINSNPNWWELAEYQKKTGYYK